MEELTQQTNIDNRIHLALSPWDLTDSYNQHAGVTLASFLQNCNCEKAAVHLLYDERLNKKNPYDAENNMKKYADLCKKFGADLYYHHVELPEWITENKAVEFFTPGTLMRFYLPDLLPEIEKILYLDCDIVVNTGIKELWNTNIVGIPLAASRDFGISIFPSEHFQRLDTTVERYFNAGVLLLNLQYLRENEYLSNKFLNILQRNIDFPLADQDVLNLLFGKTYLQLDSKYNFMVKDSDEPIKRLNSIIHYAAPDCKPWKIYHGEIDIPYWHYLLQSPWIEKHSESHTTILKFPKITKICETDFATIYEESGLPYVILMKKIITSIFALTRKRIRDFLKYHL